MRRSAPQPAMRKTPTGGTTKEDRISIRRYQTPISSTTGSEERPGLTKDGDNDDKNGRDWVWHCVIDRMKN